MKTLEINQMEKLKGGDRYGCGMGIAGSVFAIGGLALMFMFPPAAGAAALVGAVSGVGAGVTFSGTAIACFL